MKAASNYSWSTNTVLKDSPFTPGPIKGQADKDGQIVKYEWRLLGSVSFGDNDTEMDSTKTVEIQSVGTTKMDLPAEAKKLLETKADAKPAAPPAAK